MKHKHRKLAAEGKGPLTLGALRDRLRRKGPGGVLAVQTAEEIAEVRDSDDVECGGYNPTRRELDVLAAHWATELAGIHVFWFYRQGEDCDCHVETYANGRLERIAGSIGQEAVTKAFEKVWEAERKRMGEDDWRVFTEGTAAERYAIAERTYRQADERDKSREGAPTAKKPEGGE